MVRSRDRDSSCLSKRFGILRRIIDRTDSLRRSHLIYQSNLT